jgi:hypothetical protein
LPNLIVAGTRKLGDLRHFCIFFRSVILATYGDARSASQNAVGGSS